jgi:hypothetical protein
MLTRWFHRDYRPVALSFAYLAAIFRKMGHSIEYAEDRDATGDLYIFNPTLNTMPYELLQMRRVRTEHPAARILVVGQVANALPESFEGLEATLVSGEPENLMWRLDDVLQTELPVVSIGQVEDLDALPWPNWTPFSFRRFRVAYDFWQFPTALIQQSRTSDARELSRGGMRNEESTRIRSPESVVDEMRFGMEHYGFQSYKFCDPRFGFDRSLVAQLVDSMARLPRRVQFSINSRVDLLSDEALLALRDVGLTSITVGIDAPGELAYRSPHSKTGAPDREREFVELARHLGIRTIVGFNIGYQEDTVESILNVAQYAREMNPTYANFNVVAPCPSSDSFREMRSQLANLGNAKYSVYDPVVKYRHLTAEQVVRLHERIFGKFYFRSRYLVENGPLLWPILRQMGVTSDVAPVSLSATKHIDTARGMDDSASMVDESQRAA